MSTLLSVGAYAVTGFSLGYAMGAAQSFFDGAARKKHEVVSHVEHAPPTVTQLDVPAPVSERMVGDNFAVVVPPNTAPESVGAVRARFARHCAELARMGLPSKTEVHCYGGYLASLNYERRIPNWVMEEVTPSDRGAATESEHEDAAEPVSRRRSEFYADDSVPEPFRVGPTDYTTRGLSRGHLAAAAMHRSSQAELDATFSMNANVVPQDMTMNAGDWYRLERLTRKLGKDLKVDGAKRRLYVVSGPTFLPRWIAPIAPVYNGSKVEFRTNAAPSAHAARPVMQYSLTGTSPTAERAVAVPTHLYKVILSEETHGADANYAAAAFLMPNEPILEEQPLTSFQIPVERLEQITGLQFFAKALHPTRTPAPAVADLCQRHTCDVPTAAFFRVFRQVARLRAADSIPDLNRTYAAIKAESAASDENTLDKRILRELEQRRSELAELAVQPIDSI